jgi:hypothetical protein
MISPRLGFFPVQGEERMVSKGVRGMVSGTPAIFLNFKPVAAV